MFYGALAAISVSPMCMVAGIWQIAAGFIIIVVEVRLVGLTDYNYENLRHSRLRSAVCFSTSWPPTPSW